MLLLVRPLGGDTLRADGQVCSEGFSIMAGENEALLAALNLLSTEVSSTRTEHSQAITTLRTELLGRFDQMVSQREHDEAMRRIDSEHESLWRAIRDTTTQFDQHEKDSAVRIEAINKAVYEGDAAIVTRIENVEAKREEARIEQQEKRRLDRRWFAGWAVAAIVAAVAVATFIQHLFD